MTRSAIGLTCLLVTAAAVQGQQPTPADGQLPRFRAGANLVRVDAYVTLDGQVVRDLAMGDFEVLEDGQPQQIESFELVTPRGAGPIGERREPNTVAESRAMAADPESRVFVVLLDIWHVQRAGSFRVQAPLSNLLDRVIGQDDLVGVITSDDAARTLTLSRRTDSVAAMLKANRFWGERDAMFRSDPREQAIEQCYPDQGVTAGLADEMIRRRRTQRILDSIEGLIVHLEGIREERKFVFLLSEGWLLDGPDPKLARTLSTSSGERLPPPPPPPIGVGPTGRLTTDPQNRDAGLGSCERERSLLAYSDHRSQFEQLMQRANRANVSFYPVDGRGLVVFDEPIGPKPPPSVIEDARRLRGRQESLRTLAENTDGYAIINTNAIDKSLERVVQDTGAYYLLGYYSTNTRLDGRFRRLTVRVKRPGANVRARPGYLAPTEAELASTRVTALMNGAAPGHTTIPPRVVKALEGLAPARANVPLRVQTVSVPGRAWVVGELDATLLKSADWQKGGRVRATFQHERGSSAASQSELLLNAGQAVFSIAPSGESSLAPGRWVVRLELLPSGTVVPMQTTTEVIVPEAAWLMSASGMTSRRGPSTGLAYLPTADARFRRTERLRLEIPRADGELTPTARLMGRDGQPLTATITLSERVDDTLKQRLIVADLTLAPLAQGEYVLEVGVARGDQQESVAYAFRLVP